MKNESSNKDYGRFAVMFKAMRVDCATYLAEEVVNVACDGAAAIFASDDPRFDRSRFMEACGFEY